MQGHFTSGQDIIKKSPICRSYERCNKTADHILMCPEAVRVDALMKIIYNVKEWLEDIGTYRYLVYCIVRYAQGRGSRTVEEVCRGLLQQLQQLATSQDVIGWKRFMECMVSKEMTRIQNHYV